MSEKLPPASGRAVQKLLESLGFVLVRQRASHAHFQRPSRAGEPLITVPMHDEVGKKTLGHILGDISLITGVSKDDLIRLLRRY